MEIKSNSKKNTTSELSKAIRHTVAGQYPDASCKEFIHACLYSIIHMTENVIDEENSIDLINDAYNHTNATAQMLCNQMFKVV